MAGGSPTSCWPTSPRARNENIGFYGTFRFDVERELSELDPALPALEGFQARSRRRGCRSKWPIYCARLKTVEFGAARTRGGQVSEVVLV
jgi:hypothetical protein